MRNRDELLAEARRIEALGAVFADEHRRASLAGRSIRPRVIDTFLAPPALPRERWMEVDVIHDALEYRLIETRGPAGNDSSPRTITASDSAYDVLAEGEELEEKEVLAEKLTPIVERIGRPDFDAALEASVVEEVEAMLDTGELDPAAQLKTRAEIIDFLAGEIEPGRLAAAIVERRSQRETVGETIAQRVDERRITQEF